MVLISKFIEADNQEDLQKEMNEFLSTVPDKQGTPKNDIYDAAREAIVHNPIGDQGVLYT